MDGPKLEEMGEPEKVLSGRCRASKSLGKLADRLHCFAADIVYFSHRRVFKAK